MNRMSQTIPPFALDALKLPPKAFLKNSDRVVRGRVTGFNQFLHAVIQYSASFRPEEQAIVFDFLDAYDNIWRAIQLDPLMVASLEHSLQHASLDPSIGMDPMFTPPEEGGLVSDTVNPADLLSPTRPSKFGSFTSSAVAGTQSSCDEHEGGGESKFPVDSSLSPPPRTPIRPVPPPLSPLSSPPPSPYHPIDIPRSLKTSFASAVLTSWVLMLSIREEEEEKDRRRTLIVP
jgi:hypothetical protein